MESKRVRSLRPHHGWGLDEDLAGDVCLVFALATRANSYPDAQGYGPQFEAVVRAWRPEPLEPTEATPKEA